MKRLRMIPATGLAALAFALIQTPVVGHALVDMKNSNYHESWLDLALTGAGYALKLQRDYSSRANFSGMYGYGWCTDFETSIEKMPEGRLKLTECGAGQEVFYSPAKKADKALDKLADQVIAFYKKKNPRATQANIDDLRMQVTEDSEVRSSWAKGMGIAVPDVQKGVVYTADNLSVEQIIFDGTNYTRTLSDGTMQKYDNQGRLAYFYDKNGNSLKMTYAGANLKELVDNTGRKLSFTYYGATKRVKEVLGPNGLKVEYAYKGEDLATVKNMWKNNYSYDYDDGHNLTRVNFPDKTFKAITYNLKMDWVTSFADRVTEGKACLENYKYEVDRENPRDHYWSTATKKCGNEIVNESRFEFWHKTKPGGQKYLARALTKSSTDSLDITYHPDFGRPIAIKQNGVSTTFDYYANGLIKEKTTTSAKMLFEYKNSYNKVSKVVAQYFDEKGKMARKRETDFSYDTKANLVLATNSDGQKINLSYDDRGRIASIIDQAKKEVTIKYDERTGKPATITRPKVGAITVAYKANGEINKVDSTDGPTVAVQIASTFNNLLDIIAPATSELNL